MKIRNKNENTKFNRHIATAIDEIQQAIDSIQIILIFKNQIIQPKQYGKI